MSCHCLNTCGTVDRKEFTAKLASRVPVHIASSSALKRGFLRDWVKGNGMSLVLWLSGFLAAWSWCICGARPGCDLDSVKKSTDHTLSPDQGWACTEFVGGRNKLHGNLRGTRPWAQYYTCLCPGGVHKHVPAGFHLSLDRNGNPTRPVRFPTQCPINVLALKESLMAPDLPLRLFAKWGTKSGRYCSRNHGDVTMLANAWFAAQGALDDNHPYDSNSGRRALAGWLQVTHTPYHEGFEIHSDLYDVWINYQPNCQKSNFSRRTQSRDPHVASAALRRFAYLLGRGPQARVRGLDLSSKLMVGLLESNGQALLAQQIVAQHKQVNGDEDEEEPDEW